MRPSRTDQRGFRGTTHGWGGDGPGTEPRTGLRTVDWGSTMISFRLVSDCTTQHYRGGSWTWGDELAALPDGDVSVRGFEFDRLGIRLTHDEGGER
jgi:hypothetical protein